MDIFGSFTFLTKPDTEGYQAFDYDAWGDIDPAQGLNEYDFVITASYTGHDYDFVLGVWFAQARVYDSGTHRFGAVDPIKGNVGEIASIVPYTYCLNSPLKFVDPLGLIPYRELDGIGHALATTSMPHSVAFTSIMLRGRNPWLAGHQLAQVFSYKWLYRGWGFLTIELEKYLPNSRQRVDLWAKNGNTIALFEIKHNLVTTYEPYNGMKGNKLSLAQNQLTQYYGKLSCS